MALAQDNLIQSESGGAPSSFYLWTIGCQMNQADSERLESALHQLGISPVDRPEDADVLVFNSCVVRQQAEDKVVGNLTATAPLKKQRPGQVVALMGCMVGPNTEGLRRRFPHVDVFMRPQEYSPLLDLLGKRLAVDWEGCVGELTSNRPDVAIHVPIIKGCDLMCTFCIIPYRRGRQVSREPEEVVREVELLAARGVKEVTLLGQTVDAYGLDLPGKPDLADLLTKLEDVPGLERIRFLTSHPSFMSERIVRSVADLPKVCEHINLPVQAGDDRVLGMMRRPYTQREYRDLVEEIHRVIPGASMSTDIIVGFPGETREEFQRSLDLVSDLRFDKVHCAAYSGRPGTTAHRTMEDDVSPEEKKSRREQIDALQESIQRETNSQLVGNRMEVLVEDRKKGKWQGRTRSNKLVFFEDEAGQLGNLQGNLVDVTITRASPWSLRGVAAPVQAGALFQTRSVMP
jgi:tRNA-2-methylthio-N6-dimethylallyladenosine synthase